MLAESRAHIVLEHEVEAYTVHTFARYMQTPHIPTDAIAIKMMTAMNSHGVQKQELFRTVAEECVLIDGLELGARRWPTRTYYRDMGRIALESLAWAKNPPELLYERVANQFDSISRVLHCIGDVR